MIGGIKFAPTVELVDIGLEMGEQIALALAEIASSVAVVVGRTSLVDSSLGKRGAYLNEEV